MSKATMPATAALSEEPPISVMAWPLAHEQLDAMVRATWLTVLLGSLYALLVALPFAGLVPDSVIVVWALLFVAVRVARAVAARRWLVTADAARDLRAWSWWMMGSAALQGAIWGFGSWWLVAPQSPVAEAALHLALSMVALSNVQTLARSYPVLVVYALSVTVPLVLRDLWIGGLHTMLAAMAALVGGYALFSGLQHSRAHAETQRQRQRNAELIAALQHEVHARTVAQARAEQAHAEKAHVLAAAGHDLRQPLNAIGLLAQALPREASAQQVAVAAVRIYNCVEQMGDIVDGLLELSHLDAGTVRPVLAATEVGPLLAEVAAQHADAVRNKGLKLQVQAEPNLHVHSDARLLRRVLGNLVSNAVIYTAHGQVQLRAARDSDTVRLEVVDTGMGIAPKELARVFEPFYQTGNPGRDHRYGHGLGLAIVQRLCRLLEIGLQLQSVPGQGTRFELRMPAVAAPALSASGAAGAAGAAAAGAAGAAGAAEPADTADVLQGRRVLVVEDDPASAEALALLLAGWGCQVGRAGGMAEALAAVQPHWQPEFVVADLRLAAGDDGCRTALRLREAVGGRLPAVLVTGEPGHERAEASRLAGFTVLGKPLRPAQLRAFMNEAFARSEAQ